MISSTSYQSNQPIHPMLFGACLFAVGVVVLIAIKTIFDVGSDIYNRRRSKQQTARVTLPTPKKLDPKIEIDFKSSETDQALLKYVNDGLIYFKDLNYGSTMFVGISNEYKKTTTLKGNAKEVHISHCFDSLDFDVKGLTFTGNGGRLFIPGNLNELTESVDKIGALYYKHLERPCH